MWLESLVDAVRIKERDIMVMKEAEEDIPSHEVARRLLHFSLIVTNQQMHKGFQEMMTYLLRKPMEYCNHSFVLMHFEKTFRIVMALVYRQCS